MGKARLAAAVVLDAGALIAFERADARMRALVREAISTDVRLVIPAGVVGQVWREPTKQVALGALLRGAATSVTPLDQVLAEAAGVLCGRSRTSDVIDASVVLTARRERASVLTSDVSDLRQLDAKLTLHRI